MSEAGIREWCTGYLAQILDIPPERIGPDVKFARLGLDSANSVQLALALEDMLKIELDPEIVFEHPTVASLARRLAIDCGGEIKDR